MIRRFRRCGHGPGALTPEDQAVVDQLRAMLTALRNPEPWTPGSARDIAVRVGPFVERAHTRPGDDHGPEMIAVALVHPDTPHASAYLHGRQLGYTERGWLRCETSAILGFLQPGYAMLTHAAAGLPLPDGVGIAPAHYALYSPASPHLSYRFFYVDRKAVGDVGLGGHVGDRAAASMSLDEDS